MIALTVTEHSVLSLKSQGLWYIPENCIFLTSQYIVKCTSNFFMLKQPSDRFQINIWVFLPSINKLDSWCMDHPWWKTSQDLWGSLKILKDLLKILKDEDLSKIFEGSLKDPQRSSVAKITCKDPWGHSEDLVRILERS